MATINERLTKLESQILDIYNILRVLNKTVESVIKPFSKVKSQSNQANKDIFYDPDTGYWKNYGAYKDEPTEE